jgi:hypothetical protein
MSHPVFNPLVALESKPDVTSIPVVNIRFLGNRKEDVGEPEQTRPSVKIVNKRRGPEYREQILERLAKNANLPIVRINEGMKLSQLGVLEKEETITIQPIKKGKRLVIKDTIIRGPGVLMERIEGEVVQDREKLPEPFILPDDIVEEIEREPMERPIERPMEQPMEQLIEQPMEQPIEQPIEQPMEQPMEQVLEQPKKIKRKL